MRRREFVLAGGAAVATPSGAAARPMELRLGNRVATRVYFGDEWDKPFLFPIQTVGGKLLSRGFPIEPQPGDSNDHSWHRGIWYGHGMINGADLWRELGRDKTGRFVVKSQPQMSGPSTVTLDLAITPPNGPAFGSVREEFRIEDRGRLRIVDASITIAADAGHSIKFGDTEDGGFAFRLSEAFREDKGARLRNSEGLEGSKNIWGKAARWVDYSAVIDGAPAGVAILDHPGNLRYPTRWHARGYGLNSANPFAMKSFTNNQAADGSYTLSAAQKLVLRYRTLIHEGPFEPSDIERHYREYAKG